MTTRLSLDRFEGKDKSIAVLVTDDGESINVPRSLLPPSAKAGDVLTLSLERDAEATRKARRGDPQGPEGPEGDRSRRGHQAVKRSPVLANRWSCSGCSSSRRPATGLAQLLSGWSGGARDRSSSTSSTSARAIRS